MGAIIGCLAGGPLTDYVVSRNTKRHQGYFKPEFRLWCLIPAIIFGPVGLLLWGGGLGSHLPAMVAIIGGGITYAVLCLVPAIGMTYVVDCYRPLASETMTILTAFKNTFAFGLSFAVTPWLKRDGYMKVRVAQSRACIGNPADISRKGCRMVCSNRRVHISHHNPDLHVR